METPVYWIAIAVKILFILVIQVALGVPMLVWAERRVSGFIQLRKGPNRVGPLGLLQPIADAIKFFFKEDIIPDGASRFLYILSPAFVLIPAIMTFAVIPFGEQTTFFGLLDTPVTLEITHLNVGALYIFAISSLGIYGIIGAGWSSNNKYSLLGAMRACAQMVSYELTLALSVISVFLLAGTVDLRDIVNNQASFWYIFPCFLGFIVFLVSMFAETNRLPFDLPEGESELVAGYHVEYSSMKFATFFMSEYAYMVTFSALTVALFLGGWHPLPFLPWDRINTLIGIEQSFFDDYLFFLPMTVFFLKTAFILFVFIWVRWTLPRFRYDQLMQLGWKKLLPIALFNIILISTILLFWDGKGIRWM